MRVLRIRSLAAAALFASLTAVPFFARADTGTASDAFSGVWQVIVSPDSSAVQAGKEEFKDLCLFEDGKLTASACAAYGFAPSAYGIDGSTFTSTMSGGDGTIVWTASATQQGLQGQVVWTKADGHVYHYTLSGVRYAAPAEEAPDPVLTPE